MLLEVVDYRPDLGKCCCRSASNQEKHRGQKPGLIIDCLGSVRGAAGHLPRSFR
jgi:hypothetical protein